MDHLVALERLEVGEAFPTVIAVVRFLLPVSLLVIFIVGQPGEAFLTLGALVRFLPCVDTLVDLEVTLRSETFPTL